MAELAITEEYKIGFNVDGEWHHLPFNSETFLKLSKNLTKENFIFDLNSKNKPPEYFYDRTDLEVPEWQLFSAFSRVYDEKAAKNTRGGSFFQYFIKVDVPQCIKDYLPRLQIFDNLLNNRNQIRSELKECCFVYALKQTGCYDAATLNQIHLRVNNRFLSQNNINNICEEFKIHINCTYIDEETYSKNKKQSTKSTTKGKRKNFIGVKTAEPNRTHKFNIIHKHYFIEEKSPFTTYYLKHWREINDETKHDKEIRTSKGKTHYTHGVTYISSSNLIRTLFEQDCFRPITYGEISVLKSTFYNEINPDLAEINLVYNEEYCFKLIERLVFYNKNKFKYDLTYWYADFESDVREKIHKPFMVVLHSQDGKV